MSATEREPWLSTNVVMWRPDYPERFAGCNWGDIKGLYERRKALRVRAGEGTSEEYWTACEELMLACYAKFGFAAMPLSASVGGVIGGLLGYSWREEVLYETIAREYRQWKLNIISARGSAVGNASRLSQASIEGLC